MINLLPSQQKEELLEQRHLRLVLILGIVFLSFLLSLFLVLFLIKIYTSLDLETKNTIVREQNRIIALNQEIEKEIRESNSVLSKLNSFYKTNLNMSQALEKIKRNLPAGSYLTDFTFGLFKLREKEQAKISLSGYCKDRDTLVIFKENLEKEEAFSEINFSPESWVQPKDIDFDVNFKID